MPQLKQAAIQFDAWMKRYTTAHTEQGHFDNHNKALISFLDDDGGFQYVKSYDELEQLADILSTDYDYFTHEGPSRIEYIDAVEHANPKSFGDTEPVLPKHNDTLHRAADRFEHWMKRHHKNEAFKNHNDALVTFLEGNNSYRYIRTYSEFVQLSLIIKDRGYSTASLPCSRKKFIDTISTSKIQDQEMVEMNRQFSGSF